MTVGIYAKAAAGAVTTGLMAAISALDDGEITGYEWTVIVAATVIAAGAVWAVPNTPETVRRYGKAIMGGAVAVLGALGAALVDGTTVSGDEWLTIIVALLAGLGLTYAVPNADWSDGMGPAITAGPGEYSDLDRRDGLGGSHPAG